MSETIITFQDSVASALKQLDTAKETLASIGIENADLQAFHDEKSCLQAEIKALKDEKAKLSCEVSALKQEKTELEDDKALNQTEPFVAEPGKEEEEAFVAVQPDSEEDEAMEVEEKDDTEQPGAVEAASVTTGSDPEEEEEMEEEEAKEAVNENEVSNEHSANDATEECVIFETTNDPEDDPFSQLTMMTNDVVNPTGEELEDKGDEEKDSEYAFENVSVVERQRMEDHFGGFSVASGTTSSSKKRRVSKAFVKSPKKWRRMIRTHRLKSILLRP